MSCTLRFAPSPTGKLHVGNIRTALANWLHARKHGGKFILRMDDTDTDRSTEEFAQGIQRDLAWLGMDHDEFHQQSLRFDRYDLAVEHLKSTGRLYPCYETSEELTFKRKQQMGRGLPPLYDRAALKLTDADIAKYEAEGRKPHWRLQLTSDLVTWDDLVHGRMEFQGETLSDPVLIREDGRPIYTLSSVVDDLELGITHVFRGDDHIANTAVQIQLIQALDKDPASITFAHMPLLTDIAGKGLSKRLDSLSIEHLRGTDLEPMAICSFLGTLGTSESIQTFESMEALTQHFDIAKVTKSPPKFSLDDMISLNAKLLHTLPYAAVKERLDAWGIPEAFWTFIRGNLNYLPEIQTWWTICNGEVTPLIQDPDYIQEAVQLLPQAPWNEETWKTWTSAVKEQTGRKGKSLFMPLREALTGLSHGPEMKDMLPMIGYDKASKRLQGTVA